MDTSRHNVIPYVRGYKKNFSFGSFNVDAKCAVYSVGDRKLHCVY